jgi:uncharacterized protein (TIGR03067 family)
MTKYLAPVVILCVALAPQARPADPEPPGSSAKVQRELKGTWTVTKGIFGGRESKAPPGLTYAFDGDKLVRDAPFGKGNKMTYKVKIDASKKPYKITMTPEGGGRTISGIIKIEKGELYLATGRVPFGKDKVKDKDPKPPTDFKGDGVSVMVMTKEKK